MVRTQYQNVNRTLVKLNDCFHHDLTNLPAEQQAAFKASHTDATYTHKDFKADVLKVLSEKHVSDVDSGEKAIAIAASGNRRKADVVAAIQYRRYIKFLSSSDQTYDEGICFYTSSGTQIASYPKQHSENLTTKHQNTSKRFKPMARILKNLRSHLIDEEMLESGVAPSYYLEGLLYNVPNDKFVNNYVDTLVNAINWVWEADRTKFVCANERYYLLHKAFPVTWRAEKCDAFLSAAIELWKQL